MSQTTPVLPTTGVYSGLAAANAINAGFDTLNTAWLGASAPNDAPNGIPKQGMLWLDSSTANRLIEKRYDGAQWLLTGNVYDTLNDLVFRRVGGGRNTIASAGTCDIGSLNESGVTITGTTTITSFGTSAKVGETKLVTLGGAITLTHNAVSLILPGGANISGAAGDRFIAEALGSGNWQVSAYSSQSGALPAVSSINGGQIAGFRNALLNGSFNLWQRNTSYALTTSFVYGSTDRFGFYMSTTAVGIANRDVSVPTNQGFLYSLKLGRNAGQTSTGQITAVQALQTIDSLPFQGRPATFSFWAKAGLNFSGASNWLQAIVRTGTGTDQSAASGTGGGWTGDTVVINSPAVLTFSWQRFQFTATIPASATQILVQLHYNGVGTAGADDNAYITGLQFEPGSVATPFEFVGMGVDLARCQRYYEKSFQLATIPAQNVGANTGEAMATAGKAGATASAAFIPCIYKVRKRVNPTITLFNPAAANAQLRDESNSVDFSSSSPLNSSEHQFMALGTGNAATAVGSLIGVHWTADAEL